MGRNAEAMRQMIAAMRVLGRLEDIDEALVTAAESLAEAVDADPGNASLWREWRAVEESLRGLGTDGADDEFTQLLAALRAPVVHAEDEAGDKGRQGGARRRSSGSAADAVAAPGGRRRPRAES